LSVQRLDFCGRLVFLQKRMLLPQLWVRKVHCHSNLTTGFGVWID
jgi:hypothetical protein